MKTEKLQIRMSRAELGAVREAAKKAGMTASQFGASLVLKSVLGVYKPEDSGTEVMLNFRRLFCDAMELSLMGKLTVERFQNLVEKWGGR